MKKILSFENFVNEELNPTSADTSLIASIAKKVYLDLKGKGYKVKLIYQNPRLSKKGKSKEIGEKEYNQDFNIYYWVDYLTISGKKINEISEELIKKYSSDDIEVETPQKNNYGDLVFKLKEESRSRQSSRDRTKFHGFGGSDSYTMANKSQRKKGLVGTSKQYKKAYTERPT